MNSSPFGVSIVICCHNSSTRLPATLGHLGNQKAGGNLRWEVILVDNASTDGTAEAAAAIWKEHPAAPLRVIAEPQPGLAFARKRGVAEARYEIISFVDDDNWVAEDWIERTSALIGDHPEVGALGGSSLPVFEEQPPKWFDACKTLYAISSPEWRGGDCTSTRTIWGAGMAIRKTAWEEIESMGIAPLAVGRCGKSLGAGDDIELCYRLRLAGWRLWYAPELRFEHYIPKGRMDWRYARRLYRGSGEAAASLSPYEAILWPRNHRFARVWESWEWKLAQGIKSLVLSPPATLARAVLTSGEGNLQILPVEDRIGRLKGLARNRSNYYSNLAQVKAFARSLSSRRQVEKEMAVEV